VAKADFHKLHDRLYGHSAPNDPVELVNIRANVVHASNKVPAMGAPSGQAAKPLRKFPGVFNFKEHEVSVYSRADLGSDQIIDGPAVIVELTATTVVPPEWRFTVNESGHMIISKR